MLALGGVQAVAPSPVTAFVASNFRVLSRSQAATNWLVTSTPPTNRDLNFQVLAISLALTVAAGVALSSSFLHPLKTTSEASANV